MTEARATNEEENSDGEKNSLVDGINHCSAARRTRPSAQHATFCQLGQRVRDVEIGAVRPFFQSAWGLKVSTGRKI